MRYYLVSMIEARNHLRVDTSLNDSDINQKRADASDIVMEYCKVDVDDTGFDWCDKLGEPLNVPGLVRAATMLVMGALDSNRDGSTAAPNPISPAVQNLLVMYRMPSLS